MAGPEKKVIKIEEIEESAATEEVDPETFLFEDDDEEEDLSDLPAKRDADEDTFDPEDDW